MLAKSAFCSLTNSFSDWNVCAFVWRKTFVFQCGDILKDFNTHPWPAARCGNLLLPNILSPRDQHNQLTPPVCSGEIKFGEDSYCSSSSPFFDDELFYIWLCDPRTEACHNDRVAYNHKGSSPDFSRYTSRPQGSEARESSQLYVISALSVLYGHIVMGMIQMIEYDNFILFWILDLIALVCWLIGWIEYFQYKLFANLDCVRSNLSPWGKIFSNLVYLIKYQ